MKKAITAILIAAVTLGTPFFFGAYDNLYDKVIGTQHENVQRDKFKNSKSYVEGKVSDLAKYKREYEKETDPVAKKSIINLIDEEYANFDANQIENQQLYQFLMDVRSGIVGGGK